ncbi:hypothetical protein EEL31_00385 [Brevibacillus laterosporus]|nr:hypothetical protein [Brevibacillus laterosporus]TPG72894.1 hypothetical protein EEL31_00385 [Brevibacillus laterosporus]
MLILYWNSIYILLLTDAIRHNILEQFQEVGTYLLQILSDLLIFFIAWMIKVLNMGYSFIIQPPHNTAYKTKMTKLTVLIIAAIVLAAFVLISLLYVLIVNQERPYVILTYVLIPLAILLWLLRREIIMVEKISKRLAILIRQTLKQVAFRY